MFGTEPYTYLRSYLFLNWTEQTCPTEVKENRIPIAISVSSLWADGFEHFYGDQDTMKTCLVVFSTLRAKEKSLKWDPGPLYKDGF